MKKKEELMRHLLGSIDLSDIEQKEETEEERIAYCSAVFAVFPRLKKDIERAVYQQLVHTFQNSKTMDEITLGQGTANGMGILYELWQKASNEYEAKSKEQGVTFDKNSPISEL